MDVQRGHCWRCETSLDDDDHVTCNRCKVAVYCSKKCCSSDVARHSPECEVWGPKECSTCNAVGNFYACSGCLNAWYCGKQCQRQDWPRHKTACKKSTEVMKSAKTNIRQIFATYVLGPRSEPRVYLDTRKAVPEPMPNSYYIGNAIALNMLNLENNECSAHAAKKSKEKDPALEKDYSILSVGCGNLRNWIHTVVSLPAAFEGKLHTTLNDFDPFVQARNVLFLYMMMAFADKDGIAGLVTTIWYSLHLSKKHFDFLVSCLRTLTGISRADLVKAMHGCVDISDMDLELIRQVWQKWLQLECCRKRSRYINLRKQRAQMLVKDLYSAGAVKALDAYKRELEKEYVESFDEWVRNGIFLPTITARERYLPYGNPTLTGYRLVEGDVSRLNDRMFALISPECIDFIYCVTPDLQPFGAWDHILVKKSFPKMSLIDMYHGYITDQVQQAIVQLTTLRHTIAFVVCDCSNPELVRQAPKYDRIFTSNVADYIGLKTLLTSLKSSLNLENKFATIITQHWNWYMCLPHGRIDHDSVTEEDLRKAMERAAKDTGITNVFPAHLQEYFNNTSHFRSFLRAEFTARNLPEGSAMARWQDVREIAGLRLRDFSRKEVNKVVPFQYRRNIRQVSMLRQHMSRMVEWYAP